MTKFFSGSVLVLQLSTVMLAASAMAGIPQPGVLGTCTEKYDTSMVPLNYRENTTYFLELKVSRDAAKTPGVVTGTLSQGGLVVVQPTNPPKINHIGAKTIWDKNFDAAGSSKFISSDGSVISLFKGSPKDEYDIDPGIVMPRLDYETAVYTATVTFEKQGKPETIQLTCEINRAVLAELNGPKDKKTMISNDKLEDNWIQKQLEGANERWSAANDSTRQGLNNQPAK